MGQWSESTRIPKEAVGSSIHAPEVTTPEEEALARDEDVVPPPPPRSRLRFLFRRGVLVLEPKVPSLKRLWLPGFRWKPHQPVLRRLPLLSMGSSHGSQLQIYLQSQPNLLPFLLLHKVTVDRDNFFLLFIYNHRNQLFLKLFLIVLYRPYGSC